MKVIRLMGRGPLAGLAAACLLAGCVSRPATPRVVFTELTINGQPVHMMLDTGAASTVLYAKTAKRVGLNFEVPKKDVAPGPFQIVTGMSEPARVTAGGQTFTTRLPVFALPASSHRLSPDTVTDGVIGWPEVRDNILVFDAAHHMVRSVAQLPEGTSGWLKLKVRPYTTLLLETPLPDGKTGSIMVDTGAPQGVQLPLASWTATKADHPGSLVSMLHHTTFSIGAFDAETMRVNEIKLGALTLKNVPVEDMPQAEAAWLNKAAPNDELTGVIGLLALTRMDLVVDGKNGFAYMRPRPPARTGNWHVAQDVRLNCDSLLVRSGLAACGRRDFDSAVADYNQALEINPNNVDAYANRALAKVEKGDLAGALADFARALALNPNSADIHAGRALVRQIYGDFSGALADYDQVIELKPDDSINARIHRQTLLCRLGFPPGDFSKAVAGWKDNWLKTVGLFLADQLEETALLAAAEGKDAAQAPGRRCEAFYCIGMKRLCNSDSAGAAEFFRKCVATGERRYAEYHFAAAELFRLNAATPW